MTVNYGKATVKAAPNVSEDGHLSPEEEQLYRYYSLDGDSTGDRTPSSAMAIDTRTSATGDDRQDRAAEPGVESR